MSNLPEPKTFRDIEFKRGGPLAIALGIPAHRTRELERFVNDQIDQGASMAKIITDLNLRGDLTDAEWTAAIYNLGVYDGLRMQARS